MKDLFAHYLLVSCVAFCISVTLTPIIRKICHRRQFLDFPTTPRKIHTLPVPRLGGIAIYLAFFLPLAAIFLTDGSAAELFAGQLETFLSLFVTGTLVFAIGVYDDLRGATVMQKFAAQIAAALLLYFLGFKVHLLSIPFIGSVSPGMFGLPLTVLWLVGVSNAINFIDGVDGLACGVGFFAVATMFLLSLFLQNPLTAFFAAALAGGLLGFAWYNFAPASIFMGDSGSLFIGFIIAAISLQGAQKSSTAVVLLIPIVALGVPIADTLLAILRRLSNGNSPFIADQEHIHHRLLRMGFSSRQVTFVLYGVCSLLGATALLMTAVNNQGLTLLLIALSLITIGSLKMLGYTADLIRLNQVAKARLQQRHRLAERQRRAAEILAEIRTAADLAVLQKGLLRYFENLEFDIGEFFCQPAGTIRPEVTETFAFTWQSPRYEEQRLAPDQLWTIRLPLRRNHRKYGELLIGKDAEAAAALFESFMDVDNLHQAVEQALARIIHREDAKKEQNKTGLTRFTRFLLCIF